MVSNTIIDDLLIFLTSLDRSPKSSTYIYRRLRERFIVACLSGSEYFLYRFSTIPTSTPTHTSPTKVREEDTGIGVICRFLRDLEVPCLKLLPIVRVRVLKAPSPRIRLPGLFRP